MLAYLAFLKKVIWKKQYFKKNESGENKTIFSNISNVILIILGYIVIWVKILVLILLVIPLKIHMYYICQFVSLSLFLQIIDNPDNLLKHFKFICLMELIYPPKHQSFRPSKFDLAVMDFYKILLNFISIILWYMLRFKFDIL